MPNCVNCSVEIPTLKAMCQFCWHTLSSKKRMIIYGKIQKTDNKNNQMA